jgi:hypothetical protein
MAFHWKVLIAVVLVALLAGTVVAILAEWKSARAAGGFKKWLKDVPSVNYRAVSAGYLSEVVVSYLVVAIIARSIWPTVFGELQIEAIYAVFFFLGTLQGLNVAAFIGKRATANPEMVAATAAAEQAPDVLPLVTTEKTETTPKKATTTTTTVEPVQQNSQPNSQLRETTNHPVDPPKGPLTDALEAERRLTADD